MPFTKRTISGMMHCLTQPGVPSGLTLMARTASRKTAGRSHSRKESRRLAAGSAGMNPWPWSMTVPAEGGELVEERFFDVEVFAHLFFLTALIQRRLVSTLAR
jgi:hypothetical protein